MKSIFAAVFLFVVSALAQGISVAIPAEGDTLMAGQSTDVELDFPNSLTGVEHVSVVISYVACSVTPCSNNASITMGSTLYAGNYTPIIGGDPAKPPNQNISVTLPSGMAGGQTLLNVAHFYLLGASATPILEYANVTVNLDNSTSTSNAARFIRGREAPKLG
ncbi:uncharacterized protein STEHIDRAFT_167748 [Stereum hirsutum FP-91666 SS1]|uniref:uncharacterized protein n=1 Tax=Stereum hirsutum (strain FP-91666) TaxID=721885 RepID=UPI000440BC3C|nr:uncharacterized protein STEHIDRAFT_167748 [Stereum hirsutum FP-91666 SS1]EIM88464.1 hypothetical protein STEHIDRAFT_167748 [Stereum hirsutum FP-91666 SS1]